MCSTARNRAGFSTIPFRCMDNEVLSVPYYHKFFFSFFSHRSHCPRHVYILLYGQFVVTSVVYPLCDAKTNICLAALLRDCSSTQVACTQRHTKQWIQRQGSNGRNTTPDRGPSLSKALRLTVHGVSRRHRAEQAKERLTRRRTAASSPDLIVFVRLELKAVEARVAAR